MKTLIFRRDVEPRKEVLSCHCGGSSPLPTLVEATLGVDKLGNFKDSRDLHTVRLEANAGADCCELVVPNSFFIDDYDRPLLPDSLLSSSV